MSNEARNASWGPCSSSSSSDEDSSSLSSPAAGPAAGPGGPAGVSVSVEDPLNAWDPMGQFSDSFRNTMSMNITDPGTLGNRPLRPEDFACPFQTQPGETCFKGNKCKYRHGQYTPHILKSKLLL
jgi:hypothetical protein